MNESMNVRSVENCQMTDQVNGSNTPV